MPHPLHIYYCANRARRKAVLSVCTQSFQAFEGRLYGWRIKSAPVLASARVQLLASSVRGSRLSILFIAITACVRLSTPSFWRIAETCAFTVASDTPSL